MGVRVESLAMQLFGLHHFAAEVTKAPEFILAKEQAVALAASVIAVSDEYEIELSGKYVAVLGLIATVAAVYLPKALAYKARKLEEKKAAQAAKDFGPPDPEKPASVPDVAVAEAPLESAPQGLANG